MSSSSTYPCFDGVRAWAALAVIGFHALAFSTVRFSTPGGRFLAHLNVGVWVFFVTSGFLLYLPFARSNLGARSGAPAAPRIRTYAIRRAARIYPAYWVALAFWVVVLPRTDLGGAASPFAYVTLTQSYVESSFLHGLPVAWTLVTEVSFYVFLPLYACVVAAVARRARSGLVVELSGIAILLVIGMVAVVTTARGPVPLWVTVLPVRVHVFALGMLLAVLATHPWSARGRAILWHVGRPAALWWVLALGAFLAIPLVDGITLTHAASPGQLIGLDACRTLVGLFIVVPVVFGPQDRGAVRAMLRSRVFVFLGVVSYGMYLWHYFVMTTMQRDWLHRDTASHDTLLLLVVSVPATVIVAAASFFIVERPAQRLATRSSAGTTSRRPVPASI